MSFMCSCARCWEYPCMCGNEYKHLTVEQLRQVIACVEKVIKAKEEGTDDVYSDIS